MKLTYPTSPTARIVQPFGNHNPAMYPGTGRHMGVDIAGRVGLPIYAVCDGTVLEVNLTGAHGYGRHVILQHDGFRSLYAHLHKVSVDVGQTLRAGLQLGEMGGDPTDSDKLDGASTGPHLHLEIILSEPPASGDHVRTVLGWTVDPFPFLLKRYGPIPNYQARVLEPRGVRVRTQPGVGQASEILYVLQKDSVIWVTDVSATEESVWAELWSVRPEYAAVTWDGQKLLELTPVHSDPQPVPSPATDSKLDEKAIRLDEINLMMQLLETRRQTL